MSSDLGHVFIDMNELVILGHICHFRPVETIQSPSPRRGAAFPARPVRAQAPNKDRSFRGRCAGRLQGVSMGRSGPGQVGLPANAKREGVVLQPACLQQKARNVRGLHALQPPPQRAKSRSDREEPQPPRGPAPRPMARAKDSVPLRADVSCPGPAVKYGDAFDGVHEALRDAPFFVRQGRFGRPQPAYARQGCISSISSEVPEE